MTDRHFANFHIAGFTYYDGVDVFYELKIGTELDFKAEPTNPFDAYAVMIYYKDTKLGYVPREANNVISKLLNCGYTNVFEVKICRITAEAHTEKQIEVQVKIRKFEEKKTEEKKSRNRRVINQNQNNDF
jgi:hypothetical protein